MLQNGRYMILAAVLQLACYCWQHGSYSSGITLVLLPHTRLRKSR